MNGVKLSCERADGMSLSVTVYCFCVKQAHVAAPLTRRGVHDEAANSRCDVSAPLHIL